MKLARVEEDATFEQLVQVYISGEERLDIIDGGVKGETSIPYN